VTQPLTEGERWAREELRLLRAARFSPLAVARFLARSQQRSNATRRARPRVARQAWSWMAAGAAASIALGARSLRRRGLVWWGCCAIVLDWHLGMLETEDGRPRGLCAGDALTLARAWMVPLAWEDLRTPVLLAAAASDVLDGPLARRAGATRAGRDLEGLVDACFALAAVRGAMRAQRLPRTAAAAEVTRVAAGVAYATSLYFGAGKAPDPAVMRAGRMATLVRVAGLAAAARRHRRAAGALVATSSTWSAGAVVRAVRRGRGVKGGSDGTRTPG
jgi:phosphatidylglycerophosphate synthase